MHWAVDYIGIPWHAQGDGPDQFHCWSFVRHIQARHFDRILPEIPNPEDTLPVLRAFKSHPERRRWDLVSVPMDGDCVLMRQSRQPSHIGVWLDVDGGGILHCARGCGVVFQRRTTLVQSGWQIDGYYRFRG